MPHLLPSRWCYALGALLTLGALGHAPHAQAQAFATASTPDCSFTGSAAGAVQNTGADESPLDNQFLRVACWDGKEATLAWSLGNNVDPGTSGYQPLLGNRYGRVTDPDVVCNPAQHDQVTTIVVTYLLNGDATYELWQFDAPTHTLQPLAGPTLLARKADNPNVDVNPAGEAVITYALNGFVYGQVLELNTQQLYGSSLVAYEDRYLFSQPDVAVNRDNPDMPNVSFIFVATNRQTKQQSLRLVQVFSRDLRTLSNANRGPSTDVLPGYAGPFDAPRICAPVTDPQFGPCDFHAVVAETGTNSILSLHYTPGSANATPVSFGSLPTSNLLNDDLQKKATCSKPVITACGDALLATWTLEDGRLYGQQVSPVFTGTRDVVQRDMNWLGVRRRVNYGVVNQQLGGDQFISALAGRYATLLQGGAVNPNNPIVPAFYCFYSDSDRQVYFKPSNFSATSLRQAATASSPLVGEAQLTAAPNPFEAATVLTLPKLAEQESAQALTIHDAAGRLVQTLALDAAAGQVRWDAAVLPAGVYVARLRTSTGATYTYRLLHR